jgi:hypothetical protein
MADMVIISQKRYSWNGHRQCITRNNMWLYKRPSLPMSHGANLIYAVEIPLQVKWKKEKELHPYAYVEVYVCQQ